MKKDNTQEEIVKAVAKASFWIEKATWKEFQKKAKIERTNASHKLVEFVETYINLTELAEYNSPIVTAQELLDELKWLRKIVAANTCTIENADAASDDHIVILKLPSAQAHSTSLPKLTRQYIPQQQLKEKQPESILRNFLIDKKLWKAFQEKVKSEGGSASNRLTTFIKEYTGHYDVTYREQTVMIAKDIASALKQLMGLVEANTGTVESIDLKDKRVSIIKNPFSPPEANTSLGRRSVPTKSPIHRSIENDRQS